MFEPGTSRPRAKRSTVAPHWLGTHVNIAKFADKSRLYDRHYDIQKVTADRADKIDLQAGIS